MVHTGEGILTARGLADFLGNNPGASTHACVDSDVLLDGLVPDERAAWTAGPTGNSVGVQIETAAFAVMTREQWLSETDVDVWVPWIRNPDGSRGASRRIRRPRQMVRNVGRWLRAKHDRWGIPLVKLSAAEVRAGKAGVCGHIEISYAWGETDHTDPGAFPYDIAIADAIGVVATPVPKTPRVVGDDSMLIRNLKTGETALLSGGVLTGVDSAAADATNAKAGLALMLGVSQGTWDEMIAKSRNVETLSARLDALTAAVQALAPKAGA